MLDIPSEFSSTISVLKIWYLQNYQCLQPAEEVWFIAMHILENYDNKGCKYTCNICSVHVQPVITFMIMLFKPLITALILIFLNTSITKANLFRHKRAVHE